MTRRSGEAIDLPDIYRLVFDISSKGGAPRMLLDRHRTAVARR